MNKINSNYIYELTDIKFTYNKKFVLDIPDFKVKRGETIGVTGPNGCGKSTFLKILAFLLEPEQGNINFNGINNIRDYNSARKAVTLLIQETYLLKRSVFKNIAFGLKVRNIRKDLKKRVYDVLNIVGLSPDDFINRKWFELSGGETQRVALASRLILNPEVLILDEPVSNIDNYSTMLIKDAINSIKEKSDITVIATSHNQVWLNAVTDDVIRMHDGTIAGSGVENVITGPWEHDEEDLWFRPLSDDRKIFATKPPHKDSVAVLHPSNIIISNKRPSGTSAQNIIKGRISNMSSISNNGNMKVDIELSGLSLSCYITHKSTVALKLIPGEKVWIIFKASSLEWQ